MREHLPLVDHVVREVSNRIPRHVSRDDLVSAGMAGLADAARRFNAAHGVKFSTFASIRIRGAVVDELRTVDWASRGVRNRARAHQEARAHLAATLGRDPTLSELAAHLRTTSENVAALEDDINRAAIFNLDALSPQALDASLPSTGGDLSAEFEDRERKALMFAAVAALPERLRFVVTAYFFEGRPMQAIADDLGVTESRISQLRAEALVLLRKGIDSQLDPDRLTGRRQGVRSRRRDATYFAAIARASDHRTRMSRPAIITPTPSPTPSPAMAVG